MPSITVIAHRAVPSPNSPKSQGGGQRLDDVRGMPLHEALLTDWATDAHFTAYAPTSIPCADAPGGELPVRLDRGALHEGLTASMVALIGDVDDPVAHAAKQPASDAWRAVVEPQLQQSGLWWYRTRGGARVIGVLREPFAIRDRAGAEEWRARYRVWIASCKASFGFSLDGRCHDWQRLFRLPNVMRDGTAQRSRIMGPGHVPVVELPEPPAAFDTPKAPAMPANGPDLSDEKAAALWEVLQAIGPAASHDGRKHAICGAIGGEMRKSGSWRPADCRALIEAWLSDAGPDVDVEHGVQWALGAWKKAADEVSGRTVLAELVGAEAAGAIADHLLSVHPLRRLSPTAPVVAGAPFEDGLRFGVLSDNPPRPNYLVPELEIGVGRPYAWTGASNASKTLALMQLEVDLAMGRPVFGRYQCPSDGVPVLRLAYEGFAKAAEDYARLLRGTGEQLDWEALNQRLRFAEPLVFLSDENAREWLLRVAEHCAGGVLVVDPLVNACPGLDENSTEIAIPVYALEAVSLTHDVSVIVAHHHGHGTARARGHSAIIGAFGASASISQVEGQRDRRRVRQDKVNRYGFREFELALSDIQEDGSPWEATPERIRARDVSWGLRLTAEDPRPTDEPPARAQTGSVAERERSARARSQLRAAASRIIARLDSVDGVVRRAEVVDCSGESRVVALRALALLTDARLVSVRAGGFYALADGRPSDTAVAAAVGLDYDRPI